MKSRNGQTLVFPHLITNVGGGYNRSNGVFTAPRDGVYVFFCRITAAINSHDMFFQFILNGSSKYQSLVYGRTANPYRTTSNSIVLQLLHGDRVWVKMVQGGNHYSYGLSGDQTFSGYLLWFWFIYKVWQAVTNLVYMYTCNTFYFVDLAKCYVHICTCEFESFL